LVAIGVLIILLAEFSPAIAYRLIHQNEPTKQALNNNQSYSTPSQNQNENQPYPTWRNGGINGWQALQRNRSNRTNANANQVTASAPENAVTMNADAPVNLVRPNADAPIEPFYGTSELAAFEDVESTPPPASEYIVDGVGFGAHVRRNPDYVPPSAPVIHWQTSNLAGIEIVGNDDNSDIPEEHPATHTPTQMSTPSYTQSGRDNDRGRDTDLEYIAIKETILDGRFFNYFDNVSIQSLKDAPKKVLLAESGIGQSKATRFREYARLDSLPMSKTEWQTLNEKVEV